MDAFTLSAIGLSGVAWGAAGYIIGRVQREVRYRRDAAANLAKARKRAHDRADSRRYVVRSVSVPNGVSDVVTDSTTDSDSDSNGRAGSVNGDSRRRTIHRFHRGAGVDFGSPVRVTRVSDEASLAGSLL